MNDGERMGQKKSAMIMFFTGLKREKKMNCAYVNMNSVA